MFAVIKLKGHQYIVSQGDEIKVDNIDDKEKGDELVVDEVLSVFSEDADTFDLGKPHIDDASVVFEVGEDIKGKKINGMRFKSGKRYKKQYGFRHQYTVLKVKNINYNG